MNVELTQQVLYLKLLTPNMQALQMEHKTLTQRRVNWILRLQTMKIICF